MDQSLTRISQQNMSGIMHYILILALSVQCAPIKCMDIEANRLSTFTNWSHYDQAMPTRLARAGFFHNRQPDNDDTVQCFRCGIRLGSWYGRSSPWQEHVTHSPSCPFVAGTNRTNVAFLVTGTAERNHT